MSKIEITPKVISSRTHHHLSEKELKKAYIKICHEYHSHIIFAQKAYFVYILIKVIILVLHHGKREKRLSRIETTAKVIITSTHQHPSEGRIKKVTHQ